jgi:hypothetical protein
VLIVVDIEHPRLLRQQMTNALARVNSRRLNQQHAGTSFSGRKRSKKSFIFAPLFYEAASF